MVDSTAACLLSPDVGAVAISLVYYYYTDSARLPHLSLPLGVPWPYPVHGGDPFYVCMHALQVFSVYTTDSLDHTDYRDEVSMIILSNLNKHHVLDCLSEKET